MSLTRFTTATAPATPRSQTEERCDFCAVPIFPEHAHAVDVRDRRILCTCRPCYLLFTPSGAAQGRYKAIPERYAHLVDFAINSAEWDALQLPIGMAFLFYSTPAEKVVAFYPSPAGATESLLPLQAWQDLLERYPVLAEMEHDVEALLVDGRRGVERRSFIVPIDACYELVGIIRTTWKGFDGGTEAHQRIEGFFNEVAHRAGV
jgi:hypothetical protein